MKEHQLQPSGWRTVEIVVAAVVAVSFGVVFIGWNALWAATQPIFLFFWPSQAILYGMWLLPGVLVGLIIRKPGAAFFGGFVSAVVSVLLGSPYGLDAVASGAMQGAGAELVFAFTLYRRWTLPVAVLAGIAAGVGAWLHDVPIYYAEVALPIQLAYGGFILLSGALIAGVGSWLLTAALAQTGVLAPFPSGRGQAAV
jgi:energy-coupling factor transport system substrate-specific component